MIDAIFKVLNFGLFIGVIAYYARKNLIDVLKKQLLKKKADQEDLSHQIVATNTDYKSLQGQLTYQENMYMSLEEKVSLWHTRVHADHEQKKRECEKYEHDVRERMRRQADYWRILVEGKRILPGVFKTARQELLVRFKDKHAGQLYNDTVLGPLKRSE